MRAHLSNWMHLVLAAAQKVGRKKTHLDSAAAVAACMLQMYVRCVSRCHHALRSPVPSKKYVSSKATQITLSCPVEVEVASINGVPGKSTARITPFEQAKIVMNEPGL